MGRRETRRHAEEARTGLGDSLEKEVRGKENTAGQGEGSGVERALCTGIQPRANCVPPSMYRNLLGPVFSSAKGVEN